METLNGRKICISEMDFQEYNLNFKKRALQLQSPFLFFCDVLSGHCHLGTFRFDDL